MIINNSKKFITICSYFTTKDYFYLFDQKNFLSWEIAYDGCYINKYGKKARESINTKYLKTMTQIDSPTSRPTLMSPKAKRNI